MQEHGLPAGPVVEAFGSSKPGPIPWVIAALTLLCLSFTIPNQLAAIQNDVQFGVRSILATSGTSQIDVAIDGRDLTLNGAIDPKFERDWFVESLAELRQVRVVTDELEEYSPRAEAREMRVKFREAVQKINTASILFEPSSADFSSGSQLALDELTSLLKAHPERRVKIAGHTDTSGNKQKNLELSRDRARAVSGYLISRGIPREQLLAQGYGSSQPIATNETEQGRTRNRRIEVIVMN